MLAKGYGKWEVVAPYICFRPFRKFEGGAMSRLRVLRAPILPGSVAEGGCSQEAPLGSAVLFVLVGSRFGAWGEMSTAYGSRPLGQLTSKCNVS